MAHAGIADDVFEVFLSKGHHRPVDHVDHGQHNDPGEPPLSAEGQDVNPHSQGAVGAHLHQHSSVEHADSRRCGHVAIGRPSMKRPEASQDAEAHEDGQKEDVLKGGIEAHLGEGHDVEGA